MDKKIPQQWLDTLQTDFEEENFYRKKTLAFLEKHDDFWQRSNLAGHLTGSAWVLDPSGRKTLLIHHRGLDKWFQPGGHAEPTDLSLLETARREAMEECGLQELELIHERLFDLDVHVIPAKGETPEHLHYDLRFLFAARSEWLDGDLIEVRDLQWVPLERLLRALDTQQSVRRMAIKSLLLSSF